MGRRLLRRAGYSLAAAALAVGAVGTLSQWMGGTPSRFVAAARADGEANQPLDAGDITDISALERQFEAVSHRVSPAVVAISAADDPTDISGSVRADEMTPQKLQEALDHTTRTVGTGFIFDADGYILTNEHVIEDGRQLWITTDDRKVYPAVVVGSDPRADLAVLKIPASHLPMVHFGNGDACQRGQWAITLGNPYGLATEGDMALSAGVISATDRSLSHLSATENRLYSNLIQTTAQINPGNSGGPLFNIHGDVIGINTAVILPQKQTNGIGFAIPISRKLVDEVAELQKGHEIVYGYIGVIATTPTFRQRQDAGIERDIGARIETVEQNSPAAAKGGLHQGDIVLSINGVEVPDSDHFVRMIGDAPVDRPAAVDVMREGRQVSLKIVPMKRAVQYAISSETQRLHWHGLVIGPAPASLQVDAPSESRPALIVLGIDNPHTAPDLPGLAIGSVVLSVGGQSVGTVIEMQQVLNDTPSEKCDLKIRPATLPRSSVARAQTH